MKDWLKECLSARERLMYRIAMTNAKDPEKVDQEFFYNFKDILTPCCADPQNDISLPAPTK